MSFVEVLVAIGLVAVAASGLAELVVLSSRTVQDARAVTVATTVAEAKLAELRAVPWADAVASPEDALARAVPGYSDYVDADGEVAAGGATPPSAVFERRWSVVPLPADPDHAVVLQVTASRVTAPAARDAHVVSILARTAPGRS